MEDTMKTLNIERRHIKAALNRFKGYFDTTGKSDPMFVLQKRLEKCVPLYDKFDLVQCKIEELVANTDAEVTQSAEREHFETMYFTVIAEVETYISSKSARAGVSTNVMSPPSNTSPIPQDPTMNIRLPTITLPTFDGAYDGWVKFRDTFESLIHNNNALSDIQRFHYLNSALTGNAARVIQSLGVSSANYTVAWQSLKDRFEDSKSLVYYHIKSLVNTCNITKGSSSSLRSLIDDTNNHLLALRSLNEPTEHWDTLMIYLISVKLDPSTKREWERRWLAQSGKVRLRDMLNFLEEQSKLLEHSVSDSHSSSSSQQQQGTSGKSFRKPTKTITNLSTNRKNCNFCKEAHPIYNCDKLKQLAPGARTLEIQKLQLCFNCLQPGHSVKTCTRGSCRKCNRRHNTLLHKDTHIEQGNELKQDSINTTEGVDDSVPTRTCVNHVSEARPNEANRHVLLSTALVYLQDRQGNKHECRALLDSGSQSNFLTRDLCQKLKLPCKPTSMAICGIGQSGHAIKEKITDDLPSAPLEPASITIPENISLADPNFAKAGKIDMLIGAELFWELLCVGQVKSGPNAPLLQKTVLGWIIAGSINLPQRTKSGKSRCNLAINQELHDQIAKFWTIENITDASVTPQLDENDVCEQYFRATTTQDSNGRFIVRIPWTDDVQNLGNSRELALKRLLSLERKLQRQPQLKEDYVNFMKEYEELGHMREIPTPSPDEQGYYLPHHAVIKADSTTTKVRVVFDGSAKTTSGLSLNDVQHIGQTVQQDLFSILLRSRQHEYVLSGDVAKMYRQIQVHKDDRKYQRILWRPNSSDPIKTYELETVTYGTASAPFLATRTLRKIGEDHSKDFPKASCAIIRDFYVDDLLTGSHSIEEAIKLPEELSSILGKVGLELRKRNSNDPRIINTSRSSNLQLPTDCNQTPKTLGIYWTTTSDVLQFSVKKSDDQRVTKRFDPLGLVGPTTIQAKIIMQRLWELQVSWDESLPQDIHTQWLDFRNELNHLNSIKIPRHALTTNARQVELHGFCDASEKAYGACIYLRSVDNYGQCSVRLVCAKSRVAPIKTISLPRLELCAALLLAQLINKVKGALDIEIHNEYQWCDSMITLAWINAAPNKWQTFVANRVSEIQQLSSDNWNHVPSGDNPADIISRGINPLELISTTLWWNGPAWLMQERDQWPHTELQEVNAPELRGPRKMLLTTIVESDIFNQYSSLTKLTRITAYCFRFVHNVRARRLQLKANETTFPRHGMLSTLELAHATQRLIKVAQMERFSSEKRDIEQDKPISRSSKIGSLNPFLDETGLLRVGGRLSNAHIPYDQRHPIILPSNHNLTNLIISNEHYRLLHAGCQSVVTSLRRRYWPLSCKASVKKLLRQCIRCFKAKPTIPQYIMGDLPAARVTFMRPFYRVIQNSRISCTWGDSGPQNKHFLP